MHTDGHSVLQCGQHHKMRVEDEYQHLIPFLPRGEEKIRATLYASVLYKMSLLRMEKFSPRKLKPVEERLSKCTKRTRPKRWK